MDKREMLDRLAANGDERLLLGRVWDKYEQCRRRNLPEGTGFLSPAEQAAARRLLNALSVTEGYAFWGGYDGAQRRQLWFLPEWQEAPEEDAVRVVRASFYEEDALTHRDILGSLMALGLTREEREEQLRLRREYIDSVVGNLARELDNTYVVDEHGNKRKLRPKGEQ